MTKHLTIIRVECSVVGQVFSCGKIIDQFFGFGAHDCANVLSLLNCKIKELYHHCVCSDDILVTRREFAVSASGASEKRR